MWRQKWNELWLNLPISRKLSFVIGGSVGFLIFSTIVTTIIFVSISKNNEQALHKQETWFSQQETKHYIYARINSVLEYISTGDKKYLAKFHKDVEAARTFENFLLTHTTDEQLPELEEFIQLSQDWEYVLRNKVIPVYQLGNEEDAWITLADEAEPMEEELIAAVTRFSNEKEKEILELSINSTIQGERLIFFGIFMTSLSIIMAAILFIVMKNSINKPIQSLHQGTRRLSQGDLYFRVEIEGNDEFGQLGRAFNLMGERVTRLIDDAQSANRLKSEFLATISHELRTPLNGIIGFAEAIKEGLAGTLSAKQAEYVGHIYDNSKHLLTLINEVLDLSKIEAGKMDLYIQQIDVDTFFSKSLHVIQEQARSKNIKLTYINESRVGRIEADPTRVTEIMNNLLSNAVKFTPPDGSIEVILQRNNAELVVVVRDSGAGIREQSLKKLFEPFYQDEDAIDRMYEGTGLGLALTKKLVDLHGGTIAVESEIGIGTTFTITLPIKQKLFHKNNQEKENSKIEQAFVHKDTINRVCIVGQNMETMHQLTSLIAEEVIVKHCKISNYIGKEQEIQPDLILLLWDGEDRIEGQILPLSDSELMWIHKLGIPLILVTDRSFTLHEKGVIYRFAREIISPNSLDIREKIASWLQRKEG